MKIAFVFFFVLEILLSQTAWASKAFEKLQYSRPRIQSQSPSQVQAMLPGAASDVKTQVLRELIGSHTPSLNWPAFPRNWLEQSSTRAIETNTSAGFYGGLGGLAIGGIKFSINYRYALKTTMILIATNRRSRGVLEDQALSPLQSAERVDVLVERGGRTYPAVEQGYPMVGFCAFEANVNIATGSKRGIEFPVAAHAEEDQDIETVGLTFFSNFFQIDGEVPMTDYHERCKADFRDHVQSHVLRDFSRIVIEKFAFFHPDNECQPDAQPAPEGDSGCQEWHQNLGLAVTNSTIPRCKLQINGIHKCEIRGAEKTLCPMWHQHKNGRRQPATATSGAYRCDEESGLSCQWESKPKMLWGVVAWPGKARCY